MVRAKLLALVAATLLAGCGFGDDGTTYPVSAREARATLLLTEPPLEFFGNDVARARATRDGDGTIRWLLVDRHDSGMLTLVAKTEAIGPQEVRITVSVDPPAGGRHDLVAAGLAEHPAIVDFYKAAMEEQIASTLLKREYKMGAIQAEMAGAVISAIPEITRNIDEVGEQSKANSRANIERAYAEEASGAWPGNGSGDRFSEPAYGESMDTTGATY